MPFARAVTYVPGPVAAVVADGVALLVDVDPTDPVVTACRAALSGGGGADALLGVLGASAPVPAFALVATDGDALRMLVAGRAQVEFAGGAAPNLTGNGATGWLDRRVAAAPDTRLTLVDPSGPTDPAWPQLPIDAGVVLASALIVPGTPVPRVEPDADTGDIAGPPPGADGGPMVQAVICADHHLNAPHAVGACRVCGAPVPPQEPFLAPRPTLGVLVLASGETVPIDRDVLLGRAPFAVDEDGARIVTLPSPSNDLSRTHVRVAAYGWVVQITDLGSTNGTVATMPGQQAVQLRAHDPFVLVPGTVINLADEALVRFEVPA